MLVVNRSSLQEQRPISANQDVNHVSQDQDGDAPKSPFDVDPFVAKEIEERQNPGLKYRRLVPRQGKLEL
jgi:hypothetical protein